MADIFKSEAGRKEVLARYLGALDSWPVKSERRRVATRQGETFVLVCGPDAGLIRAFPHWDRLKPALGCAGRPGTQ